MKYKLAFIIFVAILIIVINIESLKKKSKIDSIDSLKDDCGQTPFYSNWFSTGDIFHNSESQRHHLELRSINGYDAAIGQFPSYVKIKSGRHFCGGTIIHNNIIITAAHCVMRGEIGYEVKIEAGFVHKMDQSARKQLRYGSKICRDPKFVLHHPKPTAESKVITAEYDIALIYLYKPFEYTDYVQPACLATKSRHLATAQCLAVGLGADQPGSEFYPNRVKILPSKRDCIMSIEKWVDQLNEIENSPDRSCYQTTMPGRRGEPCNGDSGGPMYCMEKHDGVSKQWVVGAASYGLEEKCINDTSPPYHNGMIYMDFYKMRDRITALLDHCTVPTE